MEHAVFTTSLTPSYLCANFVIHFICEGTHLIFQVTAKLRDKRQSRIQTLRVQHGRENLNIELIQSITNNNINIYFVENVGFLLIWSYMPLSL